MPTKPEVKTLEANSSEVLNVIRSEASEQYQNVVPLAENTIESIRNIGSIIMEFTPAKNEFLSALINRIGMVLITSKLYENPWGVFKKGMLEYGETIEEVFVNISKPFTFNPEDSENTVFKREIPDVKSAFHTMNYRKFYPVTVSNDELRTAFLSYSGITDLIARIIDSLYTGANYDEFITMKYMLANAVIQGNIQSATVTDTGVNSYKGIVSQLKGFSNNLEFLTNKYNNAGVYNFTKKEDQYLILTGDFQAGLDVEVLAAAFNMSKAEFMGHVIMIDSFSEMDNARLTSLFPDYTAFTEEQVATLNKIRAVIVDKDFFMVFDNFYNFTDIYNPKGLYWNYFYHVWKTFSISPFANARVFTTA